MMILFFISNPMSPYYQSEVFSGVLRRVSENQPVFAVKQVENKLKIVLRGIDSLGKALSALRKLQ